MKVFDWYIFRNVLLATVFVSLVLSVVIFLTQSLRFLELVIESGASSTSFWLLTFLALPRFFEIIVPLGLMAGTIFVYNRMTLDSELIVVRAIGYSPLAMARPALMVAGIVTLFLLVITLWAAPASLANMQSMRQVIKAQLSTLLFREGVFNQAGEGLTVYIRERAQDGELRGLLIHDSRDKAANPSTIMAKRGVIVARGDSYQVLVYDGSRQEYDSQKETLHRLNFSRYTIDLPESSPVRQRWTEPEERTILQLLNPDMSVERDVENLREFVVDLHRRITSPLLAPLFVLISCAFLLVGPVDRRGQGKRIALAVACVVALQGLYLAAFSMARQSDWGVILLYVLIVLPSGLSLFTLSGFSESLRRQYLYRREVRA